MITWMSEFNFKLYFNIYLHDWLRSQQIYNEKEKKQKAFSASLKIIQNRIEKEEKNDLLKFFIKFSFKREWDDVNHKTLLFHDIIKINCKTNYDLLYNNIKDDSVKTITMWNLMKHVINKQTSSRQTRKRKS